MEHHPPNDIKESIIINLSWNEIRLFDIDKIPVVISRNGKNSKCRILFVTGSEEIRWVQIEKIIIYPPILVIVSKLFIIHSSNKLDFSLFDEERSVFSEIDDDL